MSAFQNTAGVLAAFALAYAFDYVIAENKLFGGKTPKTDCKEWRKATEEKFKAWPRTAAPPVAFNPISNQNYTTLVKAPTD